MAWGPSVRMVADALGVELDEIRQQHEQEVAPETFDISCGRIEHGTVAALRFEVSGIVGGKPSDHRRARHAAARRSRAALAAGRRPGHLSRHDRGHAVDALRSADRLSTAPITTSTAASPARCGWSTRSRPCARRRPACKTWLDLPVFAGRKARRCAAARQRRLSALSARARAPQSYALKWKRSVPSSISGVITC